MAFKTTVFKMTVFKVWVYQNVRITVEKTGDEWQVWAEKENGKGEWVRQDIHFVHGERVYAMIAAYQFAERLLRNLEGLTSEEVLKALARG